MSVNFYDHNITTSGTITSPSGNFTTLIVNGTSVSNFNSSVSGLLPTIANSGDNRILTSTGSSVGINAEANLTFDGSTLGIIGNVGIGTASGRVVSGYKFLTINDTIGSYVDLLSNGTRIGELGAEPGSMTLAAVGTSMPLILRTNGEPRMTISANGNVGIGSSTNNANIRARLQIAASDADDDPSLGSGTGALLVTNSDSAYGTQFGVSADGVGWIQQGRVDGTATAYNLLLNPVGGNVGIGTSSPSVRLHISRDTADVFRLQNTAANGGTWDFKVGGGGFQNKNLVITRRTDGADSADLIINNTGNVGIASEPVADYKLFVNGGLRSDSATAYPAILTLKSLTNTSTGASLASQIYAYTTTNGTYGITNIEGNIYHKIDSGRTNSSSAVAFVNNNLRNFALTNDAGSLSAIFGIYNQFGHYNTSAVSPTTTTAIGFNSLLWRATGTITNAYDIYCQDVSSGATVTNRWGIYVEHTGNNYFAGKVGIGGTGAATPPELLSVMQDNNAGRTSILIDNLDQRLKMSCYYESGIGQYAEIQSLSNSETVPYALILQRQGGAVLIGTATSNGNYLLQVNSQIYATNATIATSDSRFKTNVTPINNATSIIQLLRPVSFDFIPQTDRNFSSDRQIGLIAQEVEEVLSNTDYKDSIVARCGDHFGLAYEKLVPLLIKALQETNQELQNIKNRLSALEGE